MTPLSGKVLAHDSLDALEAELLERVRAVKRDGGPLAPLTVVTGSHVLHIYLRRLLARADGAVVNVRFMTLLDVAAAVVDEAATTTTAPAAGDAGSSTRPRGALRLPDAVHPLLVERLLADDVDETDGQAAEASGGEVAHMPGALTASLRDLREGGISPKELLAISGRRWLRRLAATAARYQKELERFDDRTGTFGAASGASRPAVDAALPPGPVVVYGIYDVNALQLRLLARLAEIRSVHLLLLWRQEQEALAFAGGILARLRACGWGLEEASVAGAAPLARGKRRIISATDRHAEVEEVVRLVWAEVASGVPVAEIAILHRLDQSFDDTVCAVLRRAGLPFYRAGGNPVRRTPLGRAAIGLLHLLASDARRTTLLELLSLPCVSLRWIDPTLFPRPVRWEALTKEAGMVKGWAEFRHVLTLQIALATAGDDELAWMASRREEAEALLQVVEAFAAEADRASRQTSWAGHVASYLDLLQRVAPGERESDGFRAIADRLRGLQALDVVSTPADPVAFRRAAESVIRQAIVSGGYFQRDGLFVGNVSAVRFLRFSSVFLLECSERTFPPLVREDPLLRDGERAAINRQSGSATTYLALKRDRMEEERLLFELACQAARDRLTLSFPRQAIRSGTLRLPSVFVLEEAQSLAGTFLSADGLGATQAAWFERMPAAVSFGRSGIGRSASAAEAAAVEATDPGSADAAAETAVRALDESDLRLHVLEHGGTQAVPAIESLWPGIERVRALRAARRDAGFGPYDGMLPAELVDQAGVLTRDLSPTGASDYVACPYRFFLGRVLGVRVLPEPAETLEIAAVDRGNLVHRVLERLVARYRDGEPTGTWASYLARNAGDIDALIDAELTGLAEGIRGLPLSWGQIRQQLGEELRLYLETQLAQAADDPQLEPLDAERSFAGVRVSLDAEDAAAPALTIAGRMDRFDRTRDGLRVVDYKTGSAARQRPDDYRTGGSFQLPFYLLAASALDPQGQQGLQGCVAELHFVSERGNFTTIRLDGAALAADPRLTEQLATIRAGIEAGAFFYRPGTARANCRFCDFATVCHGRVDRHEQRKRAGSREVLDRHAKMLGERPAR